MVQKKAKPSWNDVKTQLTDIDRAGLLGIVQDLYKANKDNQIFLHSRFGLGDDVLKPYKEVISRWICPDVARNQNYSVAKAKKAITDYKRAVGEPESLAELAVFYCEEVFEFLAYCSVDDDGFYDALIRMFEQALKYIMALPEPKQSVFTERLEKVCIAGHNIGWGVGEDMSELLSDYGVED